MLAEESKIIMHLLHDNHKNNLSKQPYSRILKKQQ
jgi:hypothetical protein